MVGRGDNLALDATVVEVSSEFSDAWAAENAVAVVEGLSFDAPKTEINGTSIRITHMGPDFVLVESPTDHPPGDGFLFLRVDDSESQWQVRLPDGISAGSKRVALALASDGTPPPP